MSVSYHSASYLMVDQALVEGLSDSRKSNCIFNTYARISVRHHSESPTFVVKIDHDWLEAFILFPNKILFKAETRNAKRVIKEEADLQKTSQGKRIRHCNAP